MQLIVTINLGNYENIRIISSEFMSYEECKAELIATLSQIDHAAAERMISLLQRESISIKMKKDEFKYNEGI